MEPCVRRTSRLALLVLAASFTAPVLADPAALERARRLLNEANPKQAYMELVKLEAQLAGTIEFDYLLGVASLDSGKLEDAIVAFERVLALNPGHAGAQMDLARTFFAAGSFDLAESAFRELANSNPPPLAQQTINRYLEAIESRKRQTTPGWRGWAELGMGYDSNITGVPTDFGGAAQQSFGLIGIEATGNSIKRKAGFGTAAGSVEYSLPITRGWTLFAGADARVRGYDGESNYNSAAGDVRAGGSLNDGPTQWRLMAGFQAFNQVFLSASWLRSFETKGVPLLYLTAFVSDDRAVNKLFDGETDKSKNLVGVRSYLQYSLTPRLSAFNGLGYVMRRDKDEFARATTVEKGKDKFAELLLGLNWQFRKSCAVRAQYSYTRNDSNISIYDFNRSELSTAVRCEFN